jgi:hypothetical protein
MQFDSEMAAPLILRTPNGTGAKAPSKSANGSRANRRWEQGAKAPAAARNLISPFPFPLRGKPGREGSPHAAKSAAPPTRGLRPLVNPPQDFPRGYLTGAGLLMEAVTVRERGLGWLFQQPARLLSPQN